MVIAWWQRTVEFDDLARVLHVFNGVLCRLRRRLHQREPVDFVNCERLRATVYNIADDIQRFLGCAVCPYMPVKMHRGEPAVGYSETEDG